MIRVNDTDWPVLILSVGIGVIVTMYWMFDSMVLRRYRRLIDLRSSSTSRQRD